MIIMILNDLFYRPKSAISIAAGYYKIIYFLV